MFSMIVNCCNGGRCIIIMCRQIAYHPTASRGIRHTVHLVVIVARKVGGIVAYWSLGRPPIEVSPTIDYDEIHHPTTIPPLYHITISMFQGLQWFISSGYYWRSIISRVVPKTLKFKEDRPDLIICGSVVGLMCLVIDPIDHDGVHMLWYTFS